jgi:hypothetical protein
MPAATSALRAGDTGSEPKYSCKCGEEHTSKHIDVEVSVLAAVAVLISS